jgi:hypothetical protein
MGSGSEEVATREGEKLQRQNSDQREFRGRGIVFHKIRQKPVVLPATISKASIRACLVTSASDSVH